MSSKVKKIQRVSVLLLAVALVFPFGAIAEQAGKHKQRHEKRLERMSKHLALSAEQEQQVRSLFETNRQKFNCRELSEKDAKRDCRKSMRESVKAGMSNILSEEQQAKAKEHREKRKERKRKREELS